MILTRLRRLLTYTVVHPLWSGREIACVLANRARGKTALADGRPWMAYTAISFLAQVVRPDSLVFEYGSGGSTVFLGRRAGEVIAVEHDPQWSAAVRARLEQTGIDNVRLHTVPGDDHGDEAYRSSAGDLSGQSFETYARVIDAFPDGTFDVVIVDGRARVACLRHALPKVKHGGWLILDDSERLKYKSAHEIMRGRGKRVFIGLSPYQIDPHETTAWKM